MKSKLKVVVLTIFLIITTSFDRQDEIIRINEQDLIDSLNTNNIEEYDSHVILGDIPISSEKYKKQVRDIRDFMMDNHVFYEAENMDEITNSYNKLLNDSDNKTAKDLNLDLMKVFSKYRQGHVSVNTVYNGEPSVVIGEINDKYYIVATTDKYKNLLGAEVISINNIKMEDVIDKLEAYAIGENESFRNLTKESILNYYEILKKENVLTEEQNIYELKIGDKIKKIDIPFEKSKEFIVSKLKINGRKTELINVKQKNDNKDKYTIIKPLKLSVDNNKLHYIETKDDNLILRYNSCKENENYKIEKFTKDVCDQLENNKFSNIIIDLRYNLGGSSFHIYNIFGKMMAYQGANPDTKIKVLISNQTYSAGGDCALLFVKNFHNVEVIGKDSGFPISTSAGDVNVAYTKDTYIGINYCTTVFRQHYENVDSFLFNYKNFDFVKNTMKPDFYASQSFADYMIGNDPAMNYALRSEGNTSLAEKIKGVLK